MDSAVVEIILRGKDELSSTVERVGHSLEGLREHLSLIRDIALGNILGNLGVTGLEDAARGVVDFGKSLIDANAEMEMMRQRLNILYTSAKEGAAAFAFLQHNELTKPFDIESIMQASTQLVAFKQDITTVLPALEDVAGAMGQSLPVAARAFNDALMGRFAMLKNDLGISKEMLVQFGLEMNKAGHITNPESFTKAFLALANSDEFRGGADKLAQTWTGLMSSMSSQWFYLKANLGQGAFAVLEQQLHGLVQTLQNPQNAAAIQRFEQGLGAGLAQATVAVIHFGQTIAPYIGSAIAFVVRAWPLVERGAAAAFGAVGIVVSSFANWLQSTGFPAFAHVINAMAQAWSFLYAPARAVLSDLANGFSALFVNVAADAAPFFQALAGAFAVGMGAVQAIFGGALAIASGNWDAFWTDLNVGTDEIVKGMVAMMGGITIALIPLAATLMGPWTVLAQGVRQIVDGIGVVLASLVGVAVYAAAAMDSAIVGTMDMTMKKFGDLLSAMPSWAHPGISDNQVKAMRQGSVFGSIDPQKSAQTSMIAIETWFNQHAPGIDQNQYIHAGVTEAQAIANISATQQRILTEMGLQGGGGGGPSTFSTTSGPGVQILKQIHDLFKGLGGKFSLPDLETLLGIKDIGGGALAYTPPVGGLPVTGPSGADAAAAAVAANQTKYVFPNQGQNLGQLVASFGGTVVTPGGDRTQETLRELQKQNAALQQQLAAEKQKSAAAITAENLLRSLLHVGDLSRSALDALVNRGQPRPGRPTPPHIVLGPA